MSTLHITAGDNISIEKEGENLIISNTMIVENKATDNILFTANNETNSTISVSKTGYTPIGILFVDMNADSLDLLKYSLFGNNVYVRIKNLSNNDITAKITVRILYSKTVA